jgi:hypothetical protein
MLGRLLNQLFGEGKKGQPRHQEIDGSQLPEYDSVRGYLSPAGLQASSEKDGWFLKGFTIKKEATATEKKAEPKAEPKKEVKEESKKEPKAEVKSESKEKLKEEPKSETKAESKEKSKEEPKSEEKEETAEEK